MIINQSPFSFCDSALAWSAERQVNCSVCVMAEVDENALVGALKELTTFGRTSLENVQKDTTNGILNHFRFLPVTVSSMFVATVCTCVYSEI